MASPFDSPNPYASPVGAETFRASPRQEAFPAYAKAVFIIDLVLCSLRVPMVMLALVGIALVVIFRLAIIGAHVAAVVQFAQWASRQARSVAPW